MVAPRLDVGEWHEGVRRGSRQQAAGAGRRRRQGAGSRGGGGPGRRLARTTAARLRRRSCGGRPASRQTRRAGRRQPHRRRRTRSRRDATAAPRPPPQHRPRPLQPQTIFSATLLHCTPVAPRGRTPPPQYAAPTTGQALSIHVILERPTERPTSIQCARAFAQAQTYC